MPIADGYPLPPSSCMTPVTFLVQSQSITPIVYWLLNRCCWYSHQLTRDTSAAKSLILTSRYHLLTIRHNMIKHSTICSLSTMALTGIVFPLSLSCLPQTVVALAFALNRVRPTETRFFAVEEMLPSLHTTINPSYSGGSNSTMALPYSRLSSDPLPVLYTNNPKEVNRWLVDNVPMDPCVIGFDTESVPDAPWINSKLKGRPVTVQLATSEASLVIPLIRKNKYTKACLPLIDAVLSDENVIKCGCSVDDDMLDLKRLVPGLESLDARSRFDLGLLGKSKDRIGLKALTRIVLNLNLEKPKRISVSNWANSPLTEDQLNYAARDAWAGAAVLEELELQDPATFGAQALVDRLKLQPSLEALDKHKSRRREAKVLLSRFQRPYHTSNIPPNVSEKITDLKAILNEASEDLSDIESLAFIPDEPRNLHP